MGKYDVEIKPENKMAQAVQGAESLKLALTTRASKSIDTILLAVVCALEILLAFVSVSFAKTFDWMDAICTFSESAVTIAVFYMFITPGKNGKRGMKEFQDAYTAWRAACKTLRDSLLLVPFRQFCHSCSKEDNRRAREAEIERLENLYVTREEYEGTDEVKGYRSMTKKELKKKRKEGAFTKAAYKQILRCNEPLKTIPYNADLILDGAEKEEQQRGLKTGDHYEMVGMILKPFTCFAIMVITKILEFSRDANQNVLTVIVSILFTVFSICFSAFMGYRFGWTVMTREQRYMDSRTAFIYRFDEERKKSTVE